MTTSEREKEFLKRLKATFKIEAGEHIKAISSGLLELENQPDEETQNRLLESIFRQAHSLKGSARAVDFTTIETICQSLESIVKDFKYKGIPPAAGWFDILQRAVDAIDMIIRDEANTREADIQAINQELEWLKSGQVEMKPAIPAKTERPPQPPGVKPKPIDERTKRRFARQGYLTPTQTRRTQPAQPTEEKEEFHEGEIKCQWTGPAKTPMPQEHPVPHGLSPTLRVPSEKLDHLFLQAEEMIFMKLAVNRRLSDMQGVSSILEEMKKQRAAVDPFLKSLRKDAGKSIKEYGQIQEYFETLDTQVKAIQSAIHRLSRAIRADQRFIRSMIDTHRDNLRQTLMLPFATLTESFPWMVRDLARQKGKEIDLHIKGQEIEIDKRILEEMKDPLIHLLRNAVDHGVETPAERTRAGKSPRAVIEITIIQKEDKKVEITVSDDGKGIDPGKIKAKALNAGLIPTEEIEQLTPGEILGLIFHPGFSTSPIITDLSGQGLGLAIVKEKTEKLGGQITVHSVPGKGTRFGILLQATQATSRGILIEAAGQKFIIPTLNVHQVLLIDPRDIKTAENRETIKMGGEILSYVRLEHVLQLPVRQIPPAAGTHLQVVVLGMGDRKIAFQVDQVLEEEEVLVKELGKQLVRVRNIAGATILGTGEVVPILSAADLLKSAVLMAGKGRLPAKPEAKPELKPSEKSVLVVEDSITSRMLLKNILETAGYRVRTAVDGIDGWITVNAEKFDLAVLDVDMPGMSGFELTEKIHRDKDLSGLPVVLVTALESREDREKGIDAGADAYIVKSSFDQSNLLEVIKKLI